MKYETTGSAWRISVSDDGVGRLGEEGRPPPVGLGTSIVEALAHQLEARVDIESGPQGTIVSIIHETDS